MEIWISALEILGIPAILNTEQNSVWVPVWDSEAGAALKSRLLGSPDFHDAVMRVSQKVFNFRCAILAKTYHAQQTAFQQGPIHANVTLVPPSAGSVRPLLQEEHTVFRNHLGRLFRGEYITLDHEDHVHFPQMRTRVTFESIESALRRILAMGHIKLIVCDGLPKLPSWYHGLLQSLHLLARPTHPP
jgi:hypothetical protein